MPNVSSQGAFVLHLLRGLGRTQYLWGAGHTEGVLAEPNAPVLLDCSGFTLWAYAQEGSRAEGESLHGFLGGAAQLYEKLSGMGREIPLAEAYHRRGAHLFLLRPERARGNHIATVIAPGWMIHCSSTRKGVFVERIADSHITWTKAAWLV